jgi:Nif-specific regulatory protein
LKAEEKMKDMIAEIESINSESIATDIENRKKETVNIVAQEMKIPALRLGWGLSKLFSDQANSPSEKNMYSMESVKDDLIKLEKLINRFLQLSRFEFVASEAAAPSKMDARGIEVLQEDAKGMSAKKLSRKTHTFKGLIGHSPCIKRVYDLIEKIADTESTILITGESGTGKELVAKTIHYSSSRSQEPFVPVNCAAIPKDLLESELFGHEKGAFTGALNARIGRFELAHRGTLFLDEIAELDPSLQVKLLRVLQEREFERVGGVKTIKMDVRILVATNKDIEHATREGKFREDLYYRLNVIPLNLPPLRERAEDIPVLVNYFIHKFADKRKREPFTFSTEAIQCLMRCRWPGNVRELENLIERLTILVTKDVVTTSDLPGKFHQLSDARPPENSHAGPLMDFEIPECGIDINSIVENMERNLILKALKKTGGVKNRAAKMLGLNRTTLLEKMKKMRITLQQSVTNLPNY